MNSNSSRRSLLERIIGLPPVAFAFRTVVVRAVRFALA